MTAPPKRYRDMLANLTLQISQGVTMLRKMGLYRAYASLRDFRNPLGNIEPKEVQAKARTTAEANGLSIGFWLTKTAEAVVDPREVVADTSRLVEEVINLAPQPRAYACRRGCSFCCYETVTVSEMEASALARHMMELPEEERAKILSKLESYVEGVRTIGADQLRKNKAPCAFLDTASGECTVYAIRPYMCRALTSYDVTPCQTDDQSYQVDYIRYGAYSAALIGAAHSDMPNHMAVMKLPSDQQTHREENLAVAVLKQLSTP